MHSRSRDRPSTAAVVCGWLTVAVQLGLVAAAAWFAAHSQFGKVGLMTVALAISALPVIGRMVGLVVPTQIGLLTALFVFLGMLFGTALDFYDRYWWWDSVLHATSGFLVGLLGLVAVFLLAGPAPPRKVPIGLVAVFAVTFSCTLAVGWEIFEYAADSLAAGSDMQVRSTGVRDTMVDLIMNVLGAAALGVLAYVQGRAGRRGFPLDAAGSVATANAGRPRARTTA